MKKGFRQFAIGTLIAGAAGFVAGVLTAPKSGKEMRTDIKTKTAVTITEAEDQLKKAHTELNDLLAQVKGRGNDTKGKAKEEYDELTAKAVTAKQKVREILSAVHEGDADNKELQRALTEAKKAVKHLRLYLKK